MFNGCHVLVTTAPSLVELINKQSQLFDKKRIKHFVFDNIDLTIERYPNECELIRKRFCMQPKEDCKEYMQVSWRIEDLSS